MGSKNICKLKLKTRKNFWNLHKIISDKENFYKEEISRDLKRKIHEINYKDKLTTLLTDINKHIESINNFEM